MDVELMEAKRQRRKLNFLITQTELYAHFMQRKMNAADDGEYGADRILRQLDEDRDPRLAAIDHYDRLVSCIYIFFTCVNNKVYLKHNKSIVTITKY